MDKDLSQLGNVIAKEVNTYLHPSIIKCSTFNGKLNEDITEWLEDFELSAEASNWNDDIKIKRLPLYLTGAARSFYNVEIKNKEMKWTDVKQSIIQQFKPSGYAHHLRNILINKKQKPYQSSTSFICEMRDLCLKYNNKMLDTEIIHFIYEGMNPVIVQQLISFNPKTIKELNEKADLIEQSYLRYQGVSNISNISSTNENSTSDSLEKLKKEILNEVKSFVKEKEETLINNIGMNNYSRNINNHPKCYYCKKIGHTKYNCFLLQNRNKSNQRSNNYNNQNLRNYQQNTNYQNHSQNRQYVNQNYQNQQFANNSYQNQQYPNMQYQNQQYQNNKYYEKNENIPKPINLNANSEQYIPSTSNSYRKPPNVNHVNFDEIKRINSIAIGNEL
ncbi:MAG: hypothetical protein QM535_19595, partial [Limnohabitans sp.]|nr:hypothetical protein [Limnohabitans sp.]